MSKLKALMTFHKRGGRVAAGTVWDEENKSYEQHLVKNKLAEHVSAEDPGPEQPGGPPTDENGSGDENNLEEVEAELDSYKTHKELDDYAKRVEIPEESYPDGNMDEKKKAILDYLAE